MPKGQPNKRYTPELKIMVVETMHKEGLSYRETDWRFELPANRTANWERIYLGEGKEGFYIERRGCKSTDRPPKPDKYADAKTEICRIYDESKGRYGYRRITKELKKKFVINHKTVQRLMRKMGIFCRVRMHKYNSYKGDVGKILPNFLERDFKTDKPNQKWVTDVTEFALFGIKLYLSPIIDLYNGEVISYNLSRHPNLAQTTDILEKAFAKIPDNAKLILHSDQG